MIKFGIPRVAGSGFLFQPNSFIFARVGHDNWEYLFFSFFEFDSKIHYLVLLYGNCLNDGQGGCGMKKIAIVFVILLLLLSILCGVSSKPINSYKGNNESNLDDNVIQNIDQDIMSNNIDAKPNPIQSRALANTSWPMFRQNLNRTGLSPYNTSANNGNMLWNFMTNYWVHSSPAIGSDGTIYVGSNDENLYAFNPNGTKKWNYTTWGEIESSPAIDTDGTIYVGSRDWNLYAIYPNGTKKWNLYLGVMSLNIKSSPAIGLDGTIYFGANNDNLYAVDKNGSIKWTYTTNGYVESSPAIGSDGIIYVGSYDGKLYAIYPNGTKKWSCLIGDDIYAAPAIGSDGTIYLGCRDGRLYAVYPNGTKKWSFQTNHLVTGSPAIGPDGTIYTGSRDCNLYAINPNGTKKWNFTTGSFVETSPAISSDGIIYVGSCDGNLYAFYPNGTKKWNFSTSGGVYSSPAIGSDGTIYFGSNDRKFYAIGSQLKLSFGMVQPLSGNTNTYFNYSVNYLHTANKPPLYVNVTIDGIMYTMLETDTSDTNYLDGKDYFFNITHLDIGVHTSKFWASDGINLTSSTIFFNPKVSNVKPNIITQDNLTAIEDTYYEVIYQYEDIDRETIGQVGTWNFSTNATWLLFNPTTAMLYGTPTNDDVGTYWVNISINDTMDKDCTNFTLTVLNENDNPIITTTNVEITYEDELYEVDYNASDVDSLISNQMWSLDTNATSWLDIDSTTGIISGIPINNDVGEYWVNVSVDDDDKGLTFNNFTLIVLNVNDRPEIITEDELLANVNILYMVDYNATDIDRPLSQFTWSLNTNATWLDLDSSTGVLSGTPTNSDLGWYNVNISVDDGDGGSDWHDFILTVITEGFENDPPVITTIDKVSITAGETYNTVYEATDDRTSVDSLIWSHNSNASWLSFNKLTRSLSGNPTLSHVGWYWVNVTVNDGEGGFDSHKFTVTVYATANQPPDILTKDDINAVVGEEYSVDYEAEDDRTPIDNLQWSLETNTSDWLSIDPNTGVLSGTPELDDVGSYWVKVSVFDNEDGWDHSEFTLYVTTEPITSFEPELSNPSMTPTSGDTETMFTFSVDYSHPEGDLPDSIQVVIDEIAYDLKYNTSSNSYEYSTKLSEGAHTYYFTATLGEYTKRTEVTPIIVKRAPGHPPGDGDGDEDNTMLYAGIGIIVVIIIVVLILLFIFLKKKKGKEEEPPVEEAPPPPPEEVPPEVPHEQVPTPETPPPVQPQVPEISPEQPPTPEVTPQVPQPQVEPAPQPAPLPQVEDQTMPTPQVEPQPRVEAQEPAVEQPTEPQVQAPVPKIKTPEDNVEE